MTELRQSHPSTRADGVFTWRPARRLGCLLAASALVLGACGGEEGEGEVEVGKVILRDSEQVTSKRLAPLPLARTEVVGATWDGKVAAIGGLIEQDGGTAVSQVDLYDPDSDSWSAGPALPLPLHHAGAATLEGRLYVAGGYSNPAGPAWVAQRTVWSLGPGEASWRPEPPLQTPRGALALASLDGRLFALGGVDETGTVLRSVEILEQGGWRAGPDLQVEREHLAATVARGRVYAIGGRAGSMESNRDQVESLAPGDRAWRSEHLLGYNRGGIGAASPGGRACVAGGEEPAPPGEAGTIKPVECLDPVGWAQVGELEVPRHGLAVAAVESRLHVIGGGPRAGLTVSDAHEVFELGP